MLQTRNRVRNTKENVLIVNQWCWRVAIRSSCDEHSDIYSRTNRFKICAYKLACGYSILDSRVPIIGGCGTTIIGS